MITHFSELELLTISIQNVKQFYHDLLKFPVFFESKDKITFKPTEQFKLTFTEAYRPLSPVHIAFEVPISKFENVVSYIKGNQIHILKWPDGREVDGFETGKNVYFRDPDGNLLEIISHYYIHESILKSQGDLELLYLREIGMPVESVPDAREWFIRILGFKTDKESENFTFAISGTAHNVITSIHRKWIPISMFALVPEMRITYGVTDVDFIHKVKSKLESNEIVTSTESELCFNKFDYQFKLIISDFKKEIPRHVSSLQDQ